MSRALNTGVTARALPPLWQRFTGRLRRTGRTLKGTLRVAFDERVPLITYYTYNRNWGDALNPVLVRHLSGKEPVSAEYAMNFRHRPIYSVIGSILGNNNLSNVEVWGSGFIAPDRAFSVAPRAIHAVRGPLTRDVVLGQGLACPAIYGDPALLYPRFYAPKSDKHYDLGIIPHYVDRNDPWLQRLVESGNVAVIDVLSGVTDFVDQLCRCRVVASSSLHGVIASDAYGIPFTWISLSQRILGDGFKFRDYFLSTERSIAEPLKISKNTSVDQLLDSATVSRPVIDLERLLRACPFVTDS